MGEPIDILIEGLDRWRIDINEHQITQFELYLKELLKWNTRFNLTAIKDPGKVVIYHFLDSLSFVRYISNNGPKRIIDIGTGAGFPGIPLKIMLPDLDLTLLDSVKKKIGFLEHIINIIDLKGVEALHDRAEKAAHYSKFRESFDLAVSRAVSELRVLSEYCIPFIWLNGYFVSYKGPGAEDELRESQSAINKLGGRLESVINASIPGSDKIHNLVVIKKTQNTPDKYPRQPGKPKKSPL